jgi:hypothetical protein
MSKTVLKRNSMEQSKKAGGENVFDNDKIYITKEVKYKIDDKLQLILWELIEILKGKVEENELLSVDYLQVFNLYSEKSVDGQEFQQIVHTQEKPEYENTIYVPVQNAIDEKLFAIDDESHITLLLASEY